ncbi:MAG: UbiD family decarboxylase [Burkholderiaceae bacterium]|nr:UbiD family decarboxylase [Burkholderiaceae bacterium]
MTGFLDLRQTIQRLEEAGELHRISAEVDWDRELGAVTRKALEQKGPALLFEAIKGYRTGRCMRLVTSILASEARLRQVLGFPKNASNKDLVRHVLETNRKAIPPVQVDTGPVKQNIVTGEKIDLFEFPVPRWHPLEGGRYINTFASIVTRDPDTGVMNVGVYRGMISTKKSISVLLVKGGQHWGRHFQKYADRGQPMPVACVIGWDPMMDFIAGSPIAPGMCEYDVMGAYRGEPVQLIKCETSDLEVPASPEIVIEGFISADPSTFEMEGPFGEATGHISDIPALRPAIQVSCVTHRDNPIFRGTLEGTLPGSTSENGFMATIQRSASAWNILEGAGIPGIVDVVCTPITVGVNIVVQIRKAYQGQPKQIAAALWGNSASQYKYKNVIVVEEEIDPTSWEQIDWALAFRVNAGEGGITVFPGIFGSVLDPSTPLRDRDVDQLGCAQWNRVLIDATRNWTFERRKEWNDERFPPTVRLDPLDEARVLARWDEFGFPKSNQ